MFKKATWTHHHFFMNWQRYFSTFRWPPFAISWKIVSPLSFSSLKRISNWWSSIFCPKYLIISILPLHAAALMIYPFTIFPRFVKLSIKTFIISKWPFPATKRIASFCSDKGISVVKKCFKHLVTPTWPYLAALLKASLYS